MRSNIEVIGTTRENAEVENITALLKNVGISDIQINTQPNFEDWLAALPSKNIPGLGDECRGWIHSWGNGGGDCSSESCITGAIEETKSEVPAELAKAIYDSVADYSKSKFEAAGLTMEMLDECVGAFDLEDEDTDYDCA